MIGEAKKVCLYIEGKRVTKVEGADPTDSLPGDIVTVEVYSKKDALATGCPAWIVIAGRKYQI